jgi:hypothetical protein
MMKPNLGWFSVGLTALGGQKQRGDCCCEEWCIFGATSLQGHIKLEANEKVKVSAWRVRLCIQERQSPHGIFKCSLYCMRKIDYRRQSARYTLNQYTFRGSSSGFVWKRSSQKSHGVLMIFPIRITICFWLITDVWTTPIKSNQQYGV